MRPARLAVLLPALLAFAAWAQAAEPAKKAKPQVAGSDLAKPPVVKRAAPAAKKEAEKAPVSAVPQTFQFKHETLMIPAKWATGEDAAELLRSEFYYQWQPGAGCGTNTLWAHVTIGTDIAPCWPPDAEYFTFVKKITIDGGGASLYKRKKTAGGDAAGQDFVAGGSLMEVTFNANKRCYDMKFLTCEKWVKRFFPDFKFIMDNFKVND